MSSLGGVPSRPVCCLSQKSVELARPVVRGAARGKRHHSLRRVLRVKACAVNTKAKAKTSGKGTTPELGLQLPGLINWSTVTNASQKTVCEAELVWKIAAEGVKRAVEPQVLHEMQLYSGKRFRVFASDALVALSVSLGELLQLGLSESEARQLSGRISRDAKTKDKLAAAEVNSLLQNFEKVSNSVPCLKGGYACYPAASCSSCSKL